VNRAQRFRILVRVWCGKTVPRYIYFRDDKNQADRIFPAYNIFLRAFCLVGAGASNSTEAMYFTCSMFHSYLVHVLVCMLINDV